MHQPVREIRRVQQENVIGVSVIFFLPFFVTALTRSALFHSVKKTAVARALRGIAWRAELRALARAVDAFDDDQLAGELMGLGERVQSEKPNT